MHPLNDKIGVHQQFGYLDYDGVREAVTLMHELDVRHLRTDLPFSEQHLVGEGKWNHWLLEELREAGIRTTLSILPLGHHTNKSNLMADYFSFSRRVISEYGDLLEAVEIVDPLRYHFTSDLYGEEHIRLFGAMIANLHAEAEWAGTTLVVNGIVPDGSWISELRKNAPLPFGIVVALHANERSADSFNEALAHASLSAPGSPVWITTIGYSSWDEEAGALGQARRQCHKLRQAFAENVDRVYWAQLIDLPYTYAAMESQDLTIADYHQGLVTESGSLKPAFAELKTLLRGEGMASIPALA